MCGTADFTLMLRVRDRVCGILAGRVSLALGLTRRRGMQQEEGRGSREGGLRTGADGNDVQEGYEGKCSIAVKKGREKILYVRWEREQAVLQDLQLAGVLCCVRSHHTHTDLVGTLCSTVAE